jgi:hypothetical protein
MKASKSSRRFELNDDQAKEDYVSSKAYDYNCNGFLRELKRISLFSDAHDNLLCEFSLAFYRLN